MYLNVVFLTNQISDKEKINIIAYIEMLWYKVFIYSFRRNIFLAHSKLTKWSPALHILE